MAVLGHLFFYSQVGQISCFSINNRPSSLLSIFPSEVSLSILLSIFKQGSWRATGAVLMESVSTWR